MTADTFESKLGARFPRIHERVLAEIASELGNYEPAAVDDIWELVNTYTAVSPPHWGIVLDLARKAGIRSKQKNTSPARQYHKVCYYPTLNQDRLPVFDQARQLFCMAEFSIEDRTCPKCGCHDQVFQPYLESGQRPNFDSAEKRFLMYFEVPVTATEKTKSKPLADSMDRVARYRQEISLEP